MAVKNTKSNVKQYMEDIKVFFINILYINIDI
jgi:hypothetical protein